MATHWSGRLYALPNPDGSYLVGVVLPPGGYRDGSFRVFRGSGTLPPSGFPEMLRVENLDEWIRQKQSEGYTFAETTMRELEGL